MANHFLLNTRVARSSSGLRIDGPRLSQPGSDGVDDALRIPAEFRQRNPAPGRELERDAHAAFPRDRVDRVSRVNALRPHRDDAELAAIENDPASGDVQ